MKIIVCVKGIVNSKINKNINDDMYRVGSMDMYALQTALSLKKKYPSIEIDIICMAPMSFCDVLKRLYMYDINQIHLISDIKLAGADTYVTSLVLYQMIEKIGRSDIVLCGMSSDDSGTSQIGPSLAERLQYQFVQNVVSIEETEGNARIISCMNNVTYEIVTKLPVVASVQNPPDKIIYPSLRNFMKQKSDICIYNIQDLEVMENQIQSKTKVSKMHSYESNQNGEFLQGDLDDQVSQFVEIIKMYN